MASLESLLKHAYRKVDERDGGVCLHPGCGSSYNTDHHHCEPRSQARDRVACVENIVTLCEGPHESTYWREYWQQWQRRMYPYYMSKREQSEMERLRLKRFTDPKVRERLEELEEKWGIWEERRIKV
ncbi:hypothetical protein [Desulfosporosinus sp. OT]|uniref:hypothetical protein n=1 Tax=Desulfosporosinus sp. OT TaxID=913865 RepID=UPI00058BA2D4|nr:hypothetical protein [Desulfosporosinus sp. OT]